jgi:PAS domain S-box-containing protein
MPTPESPRLAEWIVEQTTDALIYSDAVGNIARWNRAASEMFGYSVEEALGQSLDIIIPEHLRAAHWTGFRKAMALGNTRLGGRPSLTRAVRKDGSKLYVEMTFAVVKDDAGKVVGSVAIARDVTERVQRERAAAGGAAKEG